MVTSEWSLNESKVWELLKQIPDPEIPVINIIELGIVRSVSLTPDDFVIEITPTYLGCPAMKQIENDIKKLMQENGYRTPEVKVVYSPAWTTDWLTPEAREKLRQSGIAPPEYTTVDKSSITGKPKNLRCPRCNSAEVTMISQFGSTACKALYKCNSCLEPFDYFKCI